MSDQVAVPASFSDLPVTAAAHFRLMFYAAVLHVLTQALERVDQPEELYERFPFLIEYNNELAQFGLQGMSLDDAIRSWRAGLEAWEAQLSSKLPLVALRHVAGLDGESFVRWLAIGLIEEDARFGAIYEMLNGVPGQPRPTLGLLQSWWPETHEAVSARRVLHHIQELGLLEVANPDTMRLEWGLQVPAVIWDSLRGPALDVQPGESPLHLARGLNYAAPEGFARITDLILPDGLYDRAARLPELLEGGQVSAVIVRGPQHNGRHTLLGALARELGLGQLQIEASCSGGHAQIASTESGGPSWRSVGPLATLLNAMPVIALDLLPGEQAELPPLPGYQGPVGVVLGNSGAVSGDLVDQAVALNLELPAAAERRFHWQAAGFAADSQLEGLSSAFRLTGGNIRRVARMARAIAALDQRTAPILADVRHASLLLNRQALETLAQHLEPLTSEQPAWGYLAVDGLTQTELTTLESRCRSRERLPGTVSEAFGRSMNCGVRALFSGPSGTGKTLAARLLAGSLQKDIYRLDLSAVVNKYIGETEKNLSQVFARAEELDVVLLIDEGDALLTQRTSVSTSNDRYANLETNYLLQRIESYQGILIVTTNAAERIDTAFQRRMDVVIEFRAPAPAERYEIWQLHLPMDHRVSPEYLQETAVRCVLTGGQIRNAVLHAGLLALNNGGIVNDEHLFEAVQREYRKTSELCPLHTPGLDI